MLSFASLHSAIGLRRNPQKMSANKSYQLSQHSKSHRMISNALNSISLASNPRHQSTSTGKDRKADPILRFKTIEENDTSDLHSMSNRQFDDAHRQLQPKPTIACSCELRNKPLTSIDKSVLGFLKSHRKYRKPNNNKAITYRNKTIQSESSSQLNINLKQQNINPMLRIENSRSFKHINANKTEASCLNTYRELLKSSRKNQQKMLTNKTKSPCIVNGPKTLKKNCSVIISQQEQTKKQLIKATGKDHIDETVIIEKLKSIPKNIKKTKGSKSKRRILTQRAEPVFQKHKIQQSSKQNQPQKDRQAQGLYKMSEERPSYSRKGEVKCQIDDVSSILQINQSSFLSEIEKKVLFEGVSDQPITDQNMRPKTKKNKSTKQNNNQLNLNNRYFDENLQMVDFEAYRSIPINALAHLSTHSKKNMKRSNVIGKVKRVFPKGFFEI